MTVAADVDVSATTICAAVAATTGMSAEIAAEPQKRVSTLRIKVRGLDCQNEVQQLQQVLGPLLGGAERLSFEPRAGLMTVTDAAVSFDAIRAAVASTGMTAELAELPPTSEAAVPSGGQSGAIALTAPVKMTSRDRVVFKVTGMDCADEIAILRREVGPIVGGDEKLGFDLLNGRMIVAGTSDVVAVDRIRAAVASAGMTAELWRDEKDEWSADQRRRRLQSLLTTASGAFVIAGVAIHSWIAGSIIAAFSGEVAGAAEAVPLPAIAAYLLGILTALRYVGPKAWAAARRLRPDMNLLMVAAVIGAIAIGQWFEAATVSFLFAVSLALEAWSLSRARRAVAALMELAPPTAWLKEKDGQTKEVPAGEVPVSSHIVVRPGDKIPLDGRVVAGESSVNQAPITGESVPVAVTPGKDVFAGTINGEGALEIETTKAADDTTLAHIIRMVGEAQGRRAASEQWVERFAQIYTPVVMVMALLVLAVPPLFFGAAWDVWLYRALVLLVIACPCALVISTPVSIVASLTAAARHGVLVKGGLYVERPAAIRVVAVDKTGTLTEGRPKVVEVVPFDGGAAEDVLRIAAALEARSPHPLALAILEHADGRGISAAPAEAMQAVAGKGVTGIVERRAAWLGSRRWMEERGPSPEMAAAADRLSVAGRSIVAVGSAGKVLGLIALSDAVRPQAKDAVAALRAAGIERVVMLTGDNRGTAERIAAETGVDEVRAELLPQDKVTAIEELVGRHGNVAMVGDGVNDAPAMARADLGIAMGAIGSDAAIETADIALMSDDLSKLAWLITHSRATLTVIRQNVAFSVGVKLLFTVLTVFGAASLWGAIAADVVASLLVVLNGLRLVRPA